MRGAHILVCAAGLLIALSAACSSKLEYKAADSGTDPHETVDAGEPDSPNLVGDTGTGEAGCRGLECKKVSCPDGSKTSITGTVYAPNGTLPLYNTIVYIPNDPLKDIPEGVQCDRCGAIATNPVNVALSDSQGHFELIDVPVGENIPLVVQVGKWRRSVTINVEACTENALTDPELTRLPKNRTEGDMPRIAVTTGGCDQLSCMLPKIGIDASEFGVAGADTAVTFYGGGGGGPTGMTSADTLWKNLDELKKYDVAIFSCQCSETPNDKGPDAYQAVYDYLAAGGRIFTTDFQYLWYKSSPDPALQGAANITGGARSAGTPYTLLTDFPKGQALSDWLAFVDPTGTPGQVKPDTPYYNFNNIIDPTSWQVWATSGDPSTPFGTTQYPRFMTVNVPVDVDESEQCGKAVHLDAHISNRSQDTVDSTYPLGCKAPLNGSDKALAFFFFDLSSCIQKEDAPPPLPAN